MIVVQAAHAILAGFADSGVLPPLLLVMVVSSLSNFPRPRS
jgi:hypothetical protein